MTTTWSTHISRRRTGDWLCVQHGPYVQQNFASKPVCRRGKCEGTQAMGVPFETIRALAQEANAKAKAEARAKDKAASKLPVVASDTALELKCRECAQPFAFAPDEQKRYEEKGYAQPKRCLACRSQKRRDAADTAEQAPLPPRREE